MRTNVIKLPITAMLFIVVVAAGFCPAFAHDNSVAVAEAIDGADAQASDCLETLGSLQAMVEKQLPFLTFADMPTDVMHETVEALGDIASAYSFVGRATTDNRYGYIVGVLTADDSPLYNTGLMQRSDSDGTQRTLITKGYDETPLYVVKDAYLNYDPYSPTVLHVTPKAYSASDFYAIFNLLISCDYAYLYDLAARGVTVCAPPPPYLHVTQYSGGEYRSEYIPLTADDVMDAMLCSTVYPPEEIGDYAICLVRDGDNADEAYMRNAPVPATLLELARMKCGFTVGSPDDITRAVSASMTMSAFGEARTQTITEQGTLNRLTGILKNAAPVQLGGCPYTAVLTLTLEDGSAVVVQKAADSCGTMLFGGMRCYKITNAENEALWSIFDEIYALLSE